MNRKLIIVGGGTFNPIRNHLSLAAPAFGTTARKLFDIFSMFDSAGVASLHLTKMADHNSNIVTNDDLSEAVDGWILDPEVKTIIFSAAVCDFKCEMDNIESGLHAERLSSDYGYTVFLETSEKIIGKVRKIRPDIFLVGFKTTTNKSTDDQFLAALKMMKRTKCNLVLANDTVTRQNMVITPEEAMYNVTDDRDSALRTLIEMIGMRNNLTYNKTNLHKQTSWSIYNTPVIFQNVLSLLIKKGGFIENNGNGFTPGHFCYKVSEDSFVSSQRKVDHKLVFENGLTLVKPNPDGTFDAFGERKPSVGARSQWMMLNKYKDYDCIIHTHNPLLPGSKIPIVPQKPFQCGSVECGRNTIDNMKDFGEIKAVFLEKHGANILFKRKSNPQAILEFITENIKLGEKVK